MERTSVHARFVKLSFDTVDELTKARKELKDLMSQNRLAEGEADEDMALNPWACGPAAFDTPSTVFQRAMRMFEHSFGNF